ncbi:MAG: M3 family oligoendopeptidase [Nanoarchaeota archaeon]
MKPSEWNLCELVPCLEAIDTFLKQLEEHVAKAQDFKDRLNHQLSARELELLLQHSEHAAEIMSRLGGYAQLLSASHTNDDAARALASRLSRISAAANNRLIFIIHWWKEVDEAYAKDMMKQLPRYKHYLFEIRRAKQHILSEQEERIINLKDVTGKEALLKQYELQTSTYRFKVRIKQRTKTFLDTQMHALITDKNPKVRSAAYKSLHTVYEQHQNELGDIYRSRVIDWSQENIDLRHYANHIAVRNFSNDIPDDAIQTMLEVIKKRRNIFSDYFLQKAKLLGIKKMSRDHIYAPLTMKKQHIPFDTGVKMVLNAFEQFSPTIKNLAQNVITTNHLDSQVREHKEGGAFCSTPLPSMVPFVLQSYNNEWNDVSTLAHELGHAIHSQLARNHSIFVAHAPMPLAETASIFGEILLEKSYKKRLTSPHTQACLIAKRLEGLYAAICRQAYFVLFEIQAHDLINSGATVQELCDAYYENLQSQFGPKIEIPKHFAYEWLRIPHFFQYPFYVYSYSFGNLLVLALYKQYEEKGESFIPNYIKLLSYGGSERPAKMLSEIGIDICNKQFWNSGFDVIQNMVEEFNRFKNTKSG